MNGTIHLVGYIGACAVAMPADDVEAVVRIDHVVPAPGAPPSVRGLVAIRSRILTLIDTPVVVGEAPGPARFMAIVSSEGHGYGLMLDAVEDVVELSGFRAMPSGLTSCWAQIEPQLCDFRGRVLLVVEPGRVIAAAAGRFAKAA